MPAGADDKRIMFKILNCFEQAVALGSLPGRRCCRVHVCCATDHEVKTGVFSICLQDIIGKLKLACVWKADPGLR